MNVIHIGRQLWKGYFAYVQEFEDGALIEHTVDFEMDLLFEKGSFSGTTLSEETKGLFEKPIMVKGFIDEEFISFIVEYPFSYYPNETNKLVVDYDNPNHSCEYTGAYNSETNKYEGEWTIVLGEIRKGIFQADHLEASYSGFWEMQRVN